MAQLLSPVCTDPLKFQNPLQSFCPRSGWALLANNSVSWRMIGHGRRRKGFGRVRVATGDSARSEAVADDYYALLGLAMQHAHSFSVKAFETRSELADLKREFAHIHKQYRALQMRMKKLEDQAEAAVKAKQIADEKADAAEALKNVAVSQQKEAEEKACQVQKELEEALATKEADLKAADAQAYQQGMDAVEEDYKLQVMQACNKGYALGWNDLLKQLGLPVDSPWRKTKAMRLPCPLPPAPTQVEEEAESEAEAEDEDEDEDEDDALVRKAKSPSKDKEILDLTGDEDLEANPKKTDIGTLSSDLLLAERSVDDTIAEIDAEVAADEAAEVIIEKEAEVVEGKEAEAEVAKDAEIVLQEPSDVPAQSSVDV